MHLPLCFNTSFYILLLMMAMFTYLCMYVINLGNHFSILCQLSYRSSGSLWQFFTMSSCNLLYFKYLLVRAIITTVSANNKITSMLNVTGSAQTYHLSANYT